MITQGNSENKQRVRNQTLIISLYLRPEQNTVKTSVYRSWHFFVSVLSVESMMIIVVSNQKRSSPSNTS